MRILQHPIPPQPIPRERGGKLKAMRKELMQMKKKRSQNKEIWFGEVANLNNLLLIISSEDMVCFKFLTSSLLKTFILKPHIGINMSVYATLFIISLLNHHVQKHWNFLQKPVVNLPDQSDKGNWKLPPSIPYHVIREKAREKADHAKHQRFLQEPPTSCTKDRRRQMCTKRSENMFHSHLAKLKHRFVFSAYGNY
ncbi:hypothetical protein M9H77_06195 [Catharanthus roseus]|uniref:Uncharacterized protein n=1 Tax=Catharanthus roseus TaxID=4058 RepID=A0ACC0BRD6_CATRO|nr:hypothetical protein M9H77_06195 [Catharanthus roseus]